MARQTMALPPAASVGVASFRVAGVPVERLMRPFGVEHEAEFRLHHVTRRRDLSVCGRFPWQAPRLPGCASDARKPDCDADALSEVAAAAQPRHVQAGDLVIAEGDPCQDLCVVIEGRVKVAKVSVEGREQTLLILGPGRTFNDVPVFDGGSNPANVEALEHGSFALLPSGAMHALIRRHPTIAVAAVRVLASRLRTMTLMVESLAFRNVTARVAKVIRDCAAGEQPLVEGVAHACAHITQQDLAALTGSVREVVQHALKTLENAGAIRLGRARTEVLDPAVLEDWTAGDV